MGVYFMQKKMRLLAKRDYWVLQLALLDFLNNYD